MHGSALTTCWLESPWTHRSPESTTTPSTNSRR